jgi:hypothetical protein
VWGMLNDMTPRAAYIPKEQVAYMNFPLLKDTVSHYQVHIVGVAIPATVFIAYSLLSRKPGEVWYGCFDTQQHGTCISRLMPRQSSMQHQEFEVAMTLSMRSYHIISGTIWVYAVSMLLAVLHVCMFGSMLFRQVPSCTTCCWGSSPPTWSQLPSPSASRSL